MRNFTKISPALWTSRRFLGLPCDSQRYLFLYLLTNEHVNSAGCYRLPEGYACSDLEWPTAKYREALKALEGADLIAHDADDSVIFIKRWFKHNGPANESHLKGIEGELYRVPCEYLSDEAREALEEARTAEEAPRNPRGRKSRPTPIQPPTDETDSLADEGTRKQMAANLRAVR